MPIRFGDVKAGELIHHVENGFMVKIEPVNCPYYERACFPVNAAHTQGCVWIDDDEMVEVTEPQTWEEAQAEKNRLRSE